MPELVLPTTDLHASWVESLQEWGRGVHQDGTGVDPAYDLEQAADFSAWVSRLRRQSDHSIPVDPGRVHASYWWIVEDGTYLGAITLRHELNDFLLEAGGHVGYGVRPSARGRGVATWAVSAVLDEARKLNFDRILITCDNANVASSRTIERNGGVLEDVRDTTLGRTRRYWITL
jgi:predicted acetyltransferase